MSLFDPLDDLFDLNGDGKTSLDEEYLLYKIAEDCMKDENNSEDEFEDIDDDCDLDDCGLGGYNFVGGDSAVIDETVSAKDEKASFENNETEEDTKSKFEASRKEYFSSIKRFLKIIAIIIGLLGFMNFGYFLQYDIVDDIKTTTIIFDLIATVFLILFSYSIKTNINGYRELKAKYPLYAMETEEYDKVKKKKYISVLSVIILVSILFSTTPLMKNEYIYQRSLKMIDFGDYVNAENVLHDINNDYKDKEALRWLCFACRDYESGDYYEAYNWIKDLEFKYLNNARTEKIEKLKKDMKIKHDKEIKEWEKEFKEESDYINEYANKQEQTTTTTRPTTHRYYYNDNDEDEYDVNEYDDPEDFYEYHYDDFADYYDAEDYYYDNHKE